MMQTISLKYSLMYVQYVCMYVCIDRFLLCLYFYVSDAVLYDHSACSMICDSGAFFVSASLYYSLQTSPTLIQAQQALTLRIVPSVFLSVGLSLEEYSLTQELRP